MTDRSKVRNYYAQFDEWHRLETPAGRLEFELSLRHLENYLPPGCRVLDLGGGPGRYTIELARRGYQVFLAELSPELLEIAAERIKLAELSDRILGMKEVNAVDLSQFDDESFEAIVAFGPYYHLTLESERRLAASEAFRVLTFGGLLFASFIPWMSGISDLIRRAAQGRGEVSAQSFADAFTTGCFENQASVGFQEGYYAKSEDLNEVFESVGFAAVDLLAVQGIAEGKEAEFYRIKELDHQLYETILKCIIETSRMPSVIQRGGHCIYTGRKAQPNDVPNPIPPRSTG